MTFFTSEMMDSHKALIIACNCDKNVLVVNIRAFKPKEMVRVVVDSNDKKMAVCVVPDT